MYKTSIRFPVLYFVVITVWQIISNKDVAWLANIGVCLIIFLMLAFYNLSKKSYMWKKEKNEKSE